MNKVRLPILVLLAVAGLGFGVWAYTDFSSLQSDRLALEKRISDLEKSLADANAKLVAAEKKNKLLADEEADLRKKLDALHPQEGVAEAAPQTEGGPGPNRADFQARWMERMKDPAFRKDMADRIAKGTAARAAALATKLHLTPDQTTQFTNLMVAQSAKMFEKGQQLLGADDATRQDVLASMQADQTQLAADLKSALGDDNYTQLLQAQGADVAQRETTRLNNSLSSTDSPLQPPQASQLVQTIAQANVAVRGDSLATMGPMAFQMNPTLVVTQTQQINQMVQQQAQGFLSPGQMTALQTQEQNQLNRLSARAAQMTGAATPAPAPSH